MDGTDGSRWLETVELRRIASFDLERQAQRRAHLIPERATQHAEDNRPQRASIDKVENEIARLREKRRFRADSAPPPAQEVTVSYGPTEAATDDGIFREGRA